MNITVFGKRILHNYDHYIMSLNINDFNSIELPGYRFREISNNDIDILKLGDFSLANMIPYLNREKDYCTGLLFFEEASNHPVGYIWLVRRGGNDMTYKVRNVDALISCVCVFREFRGKGIATLMLSEIINILKREKANEVKLGVQKDNTSAIRAYRKCNFRIIEEKRFVRFLRKNFPYYIV